MEFYMGANDEGYEHGRGADRWCVSDTYIYIGMRVCWTHTMQTNIKASITKLLVLFMAACISDGVISSSQTSIHRGTILIKALFAAGFGVYQHL